MFDPSESPTEGSSLPQLPRRLLLSLSIRQIFLTLAIITGACFVPFPAFIADDLGERLADAFHIPIGIVTTVAIYLILRKVERLPQNVRLSPLLAAILTTVTAGLVEVIQPLVGRSCSLVDIQNGVFGAIIACFTITLINRPVTTPQSAIFSTVAALLTIYSLVPAWQAFENKLYQLALLPLLFVADQDLPPYIEPIGISKSEKLTLESVLLPSTKTLKMLTISTVPEKYSGVLYRANGLEWRKSNALELVLFNPYSSYLHLGIRIDDYQDCREFEDRFNREIDIPPGLSTTSITMEEIANGPKTRKLDTDQVRRLLIFSFPQKDSIDFGLIEIRLTPYS